MLEVTLISGGFIIILGLIYSRADWGGWYRNWMDGWVRLLCRFFHKHPGTIIALPEHGPAIVVANHISGLDPLILISACRRPLRFLIAVEEYNRPLLNWLFRFAGCIPVDRQRRPEQALRAAYRALQKGEVVALFPQGQIQLESQPHTPLKKGMARLALWSQAPIYSMRIDNVAAAGHVLRAPFIPSHIQLMQSDPVWVRAGNEQQVLNYLTEFIQTPRA